jgi:hypothetical protein
MFGNRRLPTLVLAATLALAASGCYYAQAQHIADHDLPTPWFCNPTFPNSVTGPGMGTVNFYAGTSRGPLDRATCKEVALQFDQAKAYAQQYPTLGAAEAAGFRSTFAFIPGMGTHHGRGSITPELLADPAFNRQDPVIPNSIIDDVFDPAQPEFLQYNGNGPDAKLVGLSYYVRTTTGKPPEGFAGNNDWWHHHPTLCLRPTTAQAFAVNTTDSGCASQGGVNVHMGNYYMLHVWVQDSLEYVGDIHAPMHPCITANGAIFDLTNPCHQQGAADAPLSATAAETVGFCPIGRLAQGQPA